MALYVVRVPQAGVLPTASFRFHLTMDTLAVQLMVTTANPIADFHCQAIIHARRTRYLRASPWYSALRVSKKFLRNDNFITGILKYY